MKHPAKARGERFHLRQRVRKGVALMNHTVKTEFGGQLHLLPENGRLPLLVMLVIRGGFARARAGQMVVIQAGFADGHDAGMRGQLAQRRPQIFRRFVHVFGCQPMAAKTVENCSLSLTARRLLSRSVPMLMIRVMPAACARSSTCGRSAA